MRAFKKGEPFRHVKSGRWIPDAYCLQEMQDDLTERPDMPTFSEGYLYPRVGKEDARFILAVADEYERLIKALGPQQIRRLLGGSHE